MYTIDEFAESIICELEKDNIKLKAELEQAQQDIKDFEEIAKVWKRSYGEMETKFKILLANAEQVIEQLEKDLKESEELRAQTF